MDLRCLLPDLRLRIRPPDADLREYLICPRLRDTPLDLRCGLVLDLLLRDLVRKRLRDLLLFTEFRL